MVTGKDAAVNAKTEEVAAAVAANEAFPAQIKALKHNSEDAVTVVRVEFQSALASHASKSAELQEEVIQLNESLKAAHNPPQQVEKLRLARIRK